jgi:hypothetical protein
MVMSILRVPPDNCIIMMALHHLLSISIFMSEIVPCQNTVIASGGVIALGPEEDQERIKREF